MIPEKNKTLNSVEKQFNEELLPTSGFYKGGTAFLTDLIQVAARCEAGDPELMSASAKYGAFVQRTWRNMLIKEITAAALSEALSEIEKNDKICTRNRVQAWQMKVFGRSISKGGLYLYAQDGPGDRGSELVISEAIEKRSAELYEKYKNRLAEVVKRASPNIWAEVRKSKQ